MTRYWLRDNVPKLQIKRIQFALLTNKGFDVLAARDDGTLVSGLVTTDGDS